jgi:predicted anti-sigma-YlaC factor YlaD
MKTEHVISILESNPFVALNRDEVARIEAHALTCEACRNAYEAAQVSAALLHERAREAFEPSAFFQTRVLAELRQRQAANEKWVWSGLWRTAGGLASSMVATVATLAILTFAIPGTQISESQNSASASSAYSTDAVVFDERALADDQISDSEVLATLYETDDDVVK